MATRSNTDYRPDLGLAMEGFDETADREGFVGHLIAPVFDTRFAKSSFKKIPIAEMLKVVDDRRTSRGGYAMVEGRSDEGSFETKEYGVAEPVDSRERSINLSYWDDEMMAARRTRDIVLRNHEARIIAKAVTVGNTTAVANTKDYGAFAAAVPIDDFHKVVKAIRSQCGEVRGIHAVADWETIANLKQCEQVIERAAYGQGSNQTREVSTQHLAKILNIDGFIEATSSKNEDLPGPAVQTVSLKPMWPRDKILFFVRRTGNDLKKPQFMRTFHYTADGSQIGGTFESYYSDENRAQMIRHRLDVDENIVYPEAAHLLTGCWIAPQ